MQLSSPLSGKERCVTTLIYVTAAKETILELFASSQFFSTQKRGLRGFACYKLANQLFFQMLELLYLIRKYKSIFAHEFICPFFLPKRVEVLRAAH